MQITKDAATGRLSVDTTFPNVKFDPIAVFNPKRKVVVDLNGVENAGQMALKLEAGVAGSYTGYAIMDSRGDVAVAGSADCAYKVVIAKEAIALLYMPGNISEVLVSNDFQESKFYQTANYATLLPTSEGPSIGRKYMRNSPTSWVCHSGLCIETYAAAGIPGYGSFSKGSFEADRCVSLFGFRNKGFNFSWVPTNATSARCLLLNSFADLIPDFTLEPNEGLFMASTTVADQVLLNLQTGQRIDSANFYIYKCPDSRVDDVAGLLWFGFTPSPGILTKYPSVRPVVHMQDKYKELILHIAADTYESWVNDPSDGYDAGGSISLAMTGDVFDSIFTEYTGKYLEYLQATVKSISDDASGRIREYNSVVATFSYNLDGDFPKGYSLITHLQQLTEIHTEDLTQLKTAVTNMFNDSKNFITLEKVEKPVEGGLPYVFKCHTDQLETSLEKKAATLWNQHMVSLGQILQYLVDSGSLIKFLTKAEKFTMTSTKWSQKWSYDHCCTHCSAEYGIWFKSERKAVKNSKAFAGLIMDGSKNKWLTSKEQGVSVVSSNSDHTPFDSTRIDAIRVESVYERDNQQYISLSVDVTAHMMGTRLCTYSQSCINDVVKQVFEQYVLDKYSNARVILLGDTTKVTVLADARQPIAWDPIGKTFTNLFCKTTDLQEDTASEYHSSTVNYVASCESMRENISHSARHGGGGSNYSWTIPTRMRVYFDDVALGTVLNSPGDDFMGQAGCNASNLTELCKKTLELANTQSVQWLIDSLSSLGVFTAEGISILGRLVSGQFISQDSLVHTTNFTVDCDKLIKAFEALVTSKDNTSKVMKEVYDKVTDDVSVWQGHVSKRAALSSLIEQLKLLKQQLLKQKVWVDPGRVPVVLSKNLALLPTYLNI